jgi:hypothetical protein
MHYSSFELGNPMGRGEANELLSLVTRTETEGRQALYADGPGRVSRARGMLPSVGVVLI